MYSKVNEVNRVTELDQDGVLKLDVAFGKNDHTQENEVVTFRPEDGQVTAEPGGAFGMLSEQDEAAFGSLCREIATEYLNKYPNG